MPDFSRDFLVSSINIHMFLVWRKVALAPIKFLLNLESSQTHCFTKHQLDSQIGCRYEHSPMIENKLIVVFMRPLRDQRGIILAGH